MATPAFKGWTDGLGVYGGLKISLGVALDGFLVLQLGLGELVLRLK